MFSIVYGSALICWLNRHIKNKLYNKKKIYVCGGNVKIHDCFFRTLPYFTKSTNVLLPIPKTIIPATNHPTPPIWLEFRKCGFHFRFCVKTWIFHKAGTLHVDLYKLLVACAAVASDGCFCCSSWWQRLSAPYFQWLSRTTANCMDVASDIAAVLALSASCMSLWASWVMIAVSGAFSWISARAAEALSATCASIVCILSISAVAMVRSCSRAVDASSFCFCPSYLSSLALFCSALRDRTCSSIVSCSWRLFWV